MSPWYARARMGRDHDSGSGNAWRWGVLVVSLAVVSVLHYLTPASYPLWHVAYQRLYYLPLLFGAFWFGLWGGAAFINYTIPCITWTLIIFAVTKFSCSWIDATVIIVAVFTST